MIINVEQRDKNIHCFYIQIIAKIDMDPKMVCSLNIYLFIYL